MAVCNRTCAVLNVLFFGSVLASLILGGSGPAFASSTGCDLVNAVGEIPSGERAESGAGDFDAGDTVKFLLPSGMIGGVTWSSIEGAPRSFIGQRKTPTEFVFTFDTDVKGEFWRFYNGSEGVAYPSCEPAD